MVWRNLVPLWRLIAFFAGLEVGILAVSLVKPILSGHRGPVYLIFYFTAFLPLIDRKISFVDLL